MLDPRWKRRTSVRRNSALMHMALATAGAESPTGANPRIAATPFAAWQKPCPSIRVLLFSFSLLCSCSLSAQSPFAPKVSGPLSQRVVAYQIDATYDPAQHSVDATETLTYRNLTGRSLDRFPFHLYLNAFQPKSTWMHEAHRDGSFRSSQFESWDPKEFGSNEVIGFRGGGHGRPDEADEIHLARRRQS